MKVGMIGARGYVGEELLRLLDAHPRFEPAWIASRSQVGQPIREVLDDPSLPDLCFREVTPETVADHPVDVVVVARPNGAAAPFVDGLGSRPVIDLSADYRFDASWTYGLPEIHRSLIAGARRVANPGCYATGAQLALWPILEALAQPPVIFGVSGYSGAGRTPSARNDPQRLQDNLLPYALSGHVHEREISHQLGADVRFSPHVGDFFRGISLTLSAVLEGRADPQRVADRFRKAYLDEVLVRVCDAIPEVRDVRGRSTVHIGGFDVDQRDPRRLTWVCCLDNLLKGAAAEALQNLNLMFGYDETEGLDVPQEETS